MKANNILYINSSITGENSQSTLLASALTEQVHNKFGSHIVERHLQNLPHLDGERLAALFSDESRSPEQQQVLDEANTLLEEVKQADAIVIALPMYNFGVPSQFKAWLDHLARAGVSFRYTENGPQGLLENKPVYILAARGGFYANTGNDFQTPYVKQFFALLGITDIHFIYAEGLNISAEQKQRSINIALKEIERIIGNLGKQQAA